MGLVCALTLSLLFISRTLASCRQEECDPGYYMNSSQKCEICSEGYFTDICNTSPRCEQCAECGRDEKETKKCNFSSDVECVCKEGYYLRGGSGSSRKKCYKQLPDCKSKKCQHIPQIRTPTFTTTSTTTTTSPMTTTTTMTTTTERQNSTANTYVHTSSGLNYLILVILLLLLVPVMYCVPVLYIRNLYKYLHLCPRWRDKQDTEAHVQTITDRECLQNPTTLAITISEETPMMDVFSPAPSERPAHCAPLLPDQNDRAPTDLDLSEPWPAIVLYAVIKEVPLRRWKEFLRLLSVADQQLERVELDAGLNSMEKQYQMLRLWSQRSSANMDDIYSALHYMELSGCAQMIKESLDKLQ